MVSSRGELATSEPAQYARAGHQQATLGPHETLNPKPSAPHENQPEAQRPVASVTAGCH